MTRNDTFYKILFAIEIALLPMVIFAYLFLQPWTMSLFVAGILLAKIWIEIFNDKTYSHTIIKAIGDVLVFAVLLILFMANSLINVALGVVALVLIVLDNVFKITLYNREISETIQAVDYCNMLFVCLTLLAFTFLMFYPLITNIGLFAVILTAAVSVIYKVYFTIKYTNVIDSIKKLFRRK